MWSSIKSHPVIAVVCVGCTVGGALVGLWLAPESWTVARRLAAGALGGVGIAFTVVATRSLGAFGENG